MLSRHAVSVWCLLPGLAVCMLMGAVAHALSERSRMEFQKLTYISGDLQEAPQALSILAGGVASYLLHSNELLPGRPEIGRYETVLPPEKIDALERMLANPPLRDIPDHSGIMPEDGMARLVRLETDSAEIVKQVGPADPVDPQLENVFHELDDIALEVMKHPQKVLRAVITAPSISDGNLEIGIKFSNVGREELWMRSPAHLVSKGDGWLKIEIWPAVPRQQTMWAEQVIDLVPDRITPEWTGAGAPQIIPLATGASISFKLAGAFTEKPGRYVARVSYCNFMEQFATQGLIVGHLGTQTVAFDRPPEAP